MIFNNPRKNAQVTIFAILAILIVASVGIFAFLKTKPMLIPPEFKPIEQYFQGCIENKLREASSLMGAQGGYIVLPKFERGSEYMPFSSQLDFFGTGVPYWFYVSGNNIMRQQVPSLQGMEKQLSEFLKTEIKGCDFSNFEEQGYSINVGDGEVISSIRSNSIETKILMSLNIRRDTTASTIPFHSISINSKLGKFYNLAKKIYDKEQKELFLENYTADWLSLYAPTTDVKLSCSPKVWMKGDVLSDIQQALEGNIAAIKMEGNYYSLKNDAHKYFEKSIGLPVDENVNMLYSSSWPTRFEVSPSEEEVMIAKPVGTQPGLGILGFCWVQYHFIYDLAYPVLIQLFDNKEIFQFPVVVVIDKNVPRQTRVSEALPEVETELCNYKNTEFSIYTFDNELNPVEADIKFKCINTICDIGKTKNPENTSEAYLITDLPQCINGFLLASAEGYSDSKSMLNTNNPGTAGIMLPKLYNLSVEMSIGLVPIGRDEQAIVNFVSSDYSVSIAYPQQKTVKLKEGVYNVSVYAFRQGNIVLGAHTSQQCVKVPRKGVLGFFGFEEEKCFDINLPAQTLTQVPVGGGKAGFDVNSYDLTSSNKISIDVGYTKTPSNIIELQDIYSEIDSSEVSISFEK